MRDLFFKLLLIGSLVSSVVFFGCNKEDEANILPTLKFINPTDGDTLKQDLIEIQTEASDEDGIIIEVSFYVDGLGIGSSKTSPYKIEWDSKNLVAGIHTIRAVATDNNGGKVSSGIKVAKIGEPTKAYAGVDQYFNDGTTTAQLNANTPLPFQGTGKWSIVTGTGGSFNDDTSPYATFIGDLYKSHILRWTISTQSGSSFDELVITFVKVKYGDDLTDIDGNTYKTVWIGNQLWMAENLKVTKEVNGTAIPLVTDDTDWVNLLDDDTGKAYCYYNNSIDSLAKYGALYTEPAAKNACPTGWHLPTHAEWTELENYITADGHSGVEGAAIKSAKDWYGNGNGTDYYGFTALPGGHRGGLTEGKFYAAGGWGIWWCADDSSGSFAYFRILYYYSDELSHDTFLKSSGYSVRCLKD